MRNVQKSRYADVSRELPGVRMRLAGHRVRHPRLVTTSKMAQWEPVQGTPRRRKRFCQLRRQTGDNISAELLVLVKDNKLRWDAILMSRRTRVARTTLSQKPKVTVVTPSQLARGEAPPEVASSSVPEKAADYIPISEPLLTIEDIDAGDSDMPQLCSEYVKDIYDHLMDLELQQTVRPGYLKGCDITPHMRALIIGWLILLRSRFQLLQETLYLSVAIFDRFLQVQPVRRKKLQLVGVTAM